MLLSKLLRSKRLFTKANGETIVDLISATFSFLGSGQTAGGFTMVSEDEAGRPDLTSDRIYADHKYWDVLLKYNGISNPFSLMPGEFLITPIISKLDSLIRPAKIIVEKGRGTTQSNGDKLLKPKNVKDKKRLDAIKAKVSEVVPPNVNTSGNKNVKVRDGKVIFGEDVTSINKDNCPVPISRARLIQQLTKANLF